MKTLIEHVQDLHTTLLDSRNGYEEALKNASKDADSSALMPLLREMIALRTRDAEELERYLRSGGEAPENDGSFMSAVHRTVIQVRAMFGGLDESAIPGFVDGEERILSVYNDALEIAVPGHPLREVLLKQADALRQHVTEMKRQADVGA